VRETIRRVWGVDLAEEVMLCAVGAYQDGRLVMPRAQKPKCAVAYSYVGADASGPCPRRTVRAAETLDSWPGVVWAKALVAPGENVVGPADGMPTWIADVMTEHKDSPHEALGDCRRLCKIIEVSSELN